MVKTLTPALLDAACQQLSQRVKSSGYVPTLIIGIQTGGAEVARLLKRNFPEAEYCEVRISRPGTKQKGKGLTHRLLQLLPLGICDALRIVESRFNEWRSQGKQPVRIGKLALPIEINLQLNSRPSAESRILVVDDAIDTGATLQMACEQLRSHYPGVEVRTAVITVTTACPVCEADFYLYHNRTLCRFPWSNDYRTK